MKSLRKLGLIIVALGVISIMGYGGWQFFQSKARERFDEIVAKMHLPGDLEYDRFVYVPLLDRTSIDGLRFTPDSAIVGPDASKTVPLGDFVVSNLDMHDGIAYSGTLQWHSPQLDIVSLYQQRSNVVSQYSGMPGYAPNDAFFIYALALGYDNTRSNVDINFAVDPDGGTFAMEMGTGMDDAGEYRVTLALDHLDKGALEKMLDASRRMQSSAGETMQTAMAMQQLFQSYALLAQSARLTKFSIRLTDDGLAERYAQFRDAGDWQEPGGKAGPLLDEEAIKQVHLQIQSMGASPNSNPKLAALLMENGDKVIDFINDPTWIELNCEPEAPASVMAVIGFLQQEDGAGLFRILQPEISTGS